MGSSAIFYLANTFAVLILGEEGVPLGPFIAGSYATDWSFTFKKTDNSAYNLTGATFAGVMYSKDRAASLTLPGTFSIVSATLGTASYSPTGAETAIKGDYVFQVAVIKGGETDYFSSPLKVTEVYS